MSIRRNEGVCFKKYRPFYNIIKEKTVIKKKKGKKIVY